ncbi:metabolite transport protein [Apiospora kogelbergensis]|uniref:metabolite transport protein n=1 Tax=Apiospora kogelbergensis TaxID=1337665 RepID=UPI00312EFBB7
MAATSLPSKILVIGATGVIGKHITSAIAKASSAGSIKSISRVSILTSAATVSSPQKQPLLSSWKQQGLSVITGDITKPEDVRNAYQDIDTVVCCLGRTALLEQIELLRIAEKTDNVKWFFPSEYGTDIEYDATSKHEKPHQNKLKVRAFIKDEIKRLKVTYVVTGPYADMFMDAKSGHEEAGGFNTQTKQAVLIGDGNGKVGLTTMPDVGKLVVAALANPDASVNKALKVQSFVTTPKEILAEFESQTGAKFDVKYTAMDDLQAEEKQAWEKGDSLCALLTLRRIWAQGKTLYEKTDNEALGLSPQDMEPLSAVVGRHIRGEPC